MTEARRVTASPDERYDVAVLGTHLAGSLLATILARHGLNVLLVDSGSGEQELSGETTVPYTAEVFFLMAERFGIPELNHFAKFNDLPEHVRKTSGVRRSLGFLHHYEDREHDPVHAQQFNVPEEHAESHFFRRDVDRYARDLAVRYGAAAIPHRPHLVDVNLKDDEVHVVTSDGETYRASFVADASGAESPLVQQLGGADPEPRLRHRSRVLATHMAGVKPFESLIEFEKYAPASPWSEGTTHHVFDGGWIQLAAFGNHDDGANDVTAVVMSLDPDRFPATTQRPAEEFRRVVARFPALSRQFEDAIATTPWIADDAWQRSVSTTHAPRAFVFDRAASRQDMFFSRDVTMTAEIVHALATALLAAAKTDDWTGDWIERVARFQDGLVDFNDRILEGARIATRDASLWQAYSKLWLLWSILEALSLARVRMDALEADEGPDRWAAAERFEGGAFWFRMHMGIRDLWERAFERLYEVRDGRLSAGEAARWLFGELREAPFAPPLFGFGDPDDRYYYFTEPKRERVFHWSRNEAPGELRGVI